MAARDRVEIGFLVTRCHRALALRDAAMPRATAEQRVVWDWDIRLFIERALNEWPFDRAPAGTINAINDGWKIARQTGVSLADAMRKSRGYYRL
jgi:hypothetical protein